MHVVGIKQSTRFYVCEPFLDRRHEAVPLMAAGVLGLATHEREHVLRRQHWLHG